MASLSEECSGLKERVDDIDCFIGINLTAGSADVIALRNRAVTAAGHRVGAWNDPRNLHPPDYLVRTSYEADYCRFRRVIDAGKVKIRLDLYEIPRES